MLLNIWIGRARTGKSGRVLEEIRKMGDGGSQILLVPEHASHQAEVDLCRVCGDTACRHAEVLSFRRLCDRVLSVTGGMAQVSLDAGGKLLTLQRCVTELAPSLRLYRRPSRKAAFLSQLLDVFDELRAYAVTPELLYEKAQNTSGSTRDKLADLSLLYGAYESRLRRDGMDVRDRMSRLADHLEASRYAVGKDIFIDGFTYFNAQERGILETLLRQARSVTVTLLGEPDSREEIFEPALKTMEQLRRMAKNAGCPVNIEAMEAAFPGPLGHLERYFFGKTVPYEGTVPADERQGETGNADSGAPEGDPQFIRVRECRTALSEVEQTAADIVRLVSAGGARYRDITVTARNLEDYVAGIETVFARWNIPAYLSRRSDILEKPALSLIIGALSAVTGGYEYEDMFRWLKTGLSGLTAEECDILENYAVKWEIHGSMWVRDTDWTEHPDGYGRPWNEADEERLALVNGLRRRVQEPLFALAEELKAGKTAREKVEALYSFMETLGLQESLEGQMRRQAEAGRMQEAEETAQLWDTLCGVLDQFVELLSEEEMDAETFVQLFRQVVTQYSVGTIPASLDQVSVSELTRNDRHTAKYVFLLGANDHVLPAAGQTGGILNEEDRQALAVQGVELAPTGMDQMAVELQNLYAALAQPTAGLTVSYPVSGPAGGELRPAFVVNRLLALFPGLRVEREAPDALLTALIPAMELAGQDRNGPLWRYFQERSREDGPRSRWMRERLAAMERAAALRRGSLSREAVRTLYGKRVSLSASRLERIRACHFAYFMEYGLRARPRRTASFDAPQIGTFLHYLLEHVNRDVLALGGFSAVEDDTLRELTDRYIRRFAEEELGGLEKKNARFRYLFRRLRTTAWSIVEQTAEELRHSDFVPLEFELSFGEGKQLPGVSIQTADASLRVGGKVDRVDGWVKGDSLYLRVIDYKSGKKRFELGAVRMGLDIQLLLYLFALEKSGGDWFGKDIRPAGALYLPARDDILPADRNITAEGLRKLREKAYRRSGLVLAEPEVLQAMEHESLTEPHYLPMRVKKDGTLSGDIASAAQLGKLGLYVEKLVKEIAGEVRDGCIDADPCGKSEEDSPCRFCDWAAACHFRDGQDDDRFRYLRPLSREEFWDAVEREV